MRKLWFIFRKEYLLLIRDIPGLIILFLMPILLIFIVTLAQESTRISQNSKTRILYVDESHSPFSAKLLANLDTSGFFQPVHQINKIPVSATQAKLLIGNGDFKFGVVIRPADSAISLLLDPTLQDAYKSSITSSIKFIVKVTQTKEAVNDILHTLPVNIRPAFEAMITQSIRKFPPVVESYALRELSTLQPNMVQNNVPGFILFAMFFIVIPLAGSLITEKNEGSFQRLNSLPVSFSAILGGKVLAYLGVCILQFLLMVFIGTRIFPTCFGLPQLQIGHHYIAIFLATVSASLAAIGFGVLVGTASKTHNQAAMFGSVMVVLLGVISGIFLPIHLMPAFIRYISYLSPIRWGIDNYLNLFIREGDVLSILPNSILLVLFFGFAMITSIAIFAKRK